MGRGGSRYGAGRPGWRVKAENCLRLDVRDLARRQLLDGASFAWSWSNSVTGEKLGSISVTTRPEWATLSFSSGGLPVCQDIQVINTPCHFGGTRPWFLSPCCGRRVGVLYFRAGRFKCRTCGCVAYASQSQDDIGRSWLRQRKLEQRIADNWSRPRGMHRANYERIVNRIMACEHARDVALWGLLRKLGIKAPDW